MTDPHKVYANWSFFIRNGLVYIRIENLERLLDRAMFIKSGAWRFYFSPGSTYSLVILSSNVRFEGLPDFIIRSPEIINVFLKEKNIRVDNIGT